MSAGAIATGAATDALPAAALEWTYDPWRERPAHAALGAVLALGLCALVISLREPWLVTLVLSIVAVTAVAPLFAPARCRIEAEGVALGGRFGWTRRRWEELRRAKLTHRGLFVSPYAEPHWLDARRALFLPLPVHGREALLAALRTTLEGHGLAR